MFVYKNEKRDCFNWSPLHSVINPMCIVEFGVHLSLAYVVNLRAGGEFEGGAGILEAKGRNT